MYLYIKLSLFFTFNSFLKVIAKNCSVSSMCDQKKYELYTCAIVIMGCFLI